MKRRMERRAVVLMYHRVADVAPDVWRLAVHPQRFEEQLQVLSRNWQVVPLADLVKDLIHQKLKRKCVAITFDDGYADNSILARPLLEKYRLPATFFITTGNIGQQTEFWWDVLEHMMLSAKELPQHLTLQIGQTQVTFDLGDERWLTADLERKHYTWKAYVQEPPTLRCTLFLRLWEALKPLPHQAQQQHLRQLKAWSGFSTTTRPLFHSMHEQQLRELAQHDLFQLGAHTVSHPDLASLSVTEQQQEILGSKTTLERVTGTEIQLLAYPYGSCNDETVTITAEAGFLAAVTTAGCLVNPDTDRYRLGRFLADDWSGKQLDQYLTAWLHA
jgi:peptidoglycan/xylan/chitin deacetylase (PgdA/CDA1 family)